MQNEQTTRPDALQACPACSHYHGNLSCQRLLGESYPQNMCGCSHKYKETLDDLDVERFAQLQAAISALGAVEVAPGYYSWEDAYAGWVVSPEANLEIIRRYRVDREPKRPLPLKDYAVPMPAWWTPDRRFARRCTGAGVEGRRCHTIVPDFEHCPAQSAECMGYYERITADLNSGEEIPC